MTSSYSNCARTVAHPLTTGFRVTIFLSRICVAHLSGPLRVVVAFSAHNVATILLVGPHDDRGSVDGCVLSALRARGSG